MTDTLPALPRPRPLVRGLSVVGHLLFLMTVAGFLAMCGTALRIHFTGIALVVVILLLAIAAVATLALRFRLGRRAGWCAQLATVAVAAIWYQTLTPRQDRAWAPDVTHSVSGTVNGNMVTLHNLRNFDWSDAQTAVERWETRSYDLGKLETADMITSVWDNPDIAHLIVSFGFEGGEQVAFSVEIRKERGEAFSSVGGFFRQFEIALIAADEADVVKLRTNLRNEDVSLYRLALDPDQRRALFLSYVDFGNQLNESPQFYNTVTANCASTVWRLAKVVKDDVPMDYRLLLSGRLPEFLDELGALQGADPMAARRAAARISDHAMGVPEGADFSAWIRRG
ncbi:MAG: DUF4105 domain-containing protein [Paracoccaceae bacterium]